MTVAAQYVDPRPAEAASLVRIAAPLLRQGERRARTNGDSVVMLLLRQDVGLPLEVAVDCRDAHREAEALARAAEVGRTVMVEAGGVGYRTDHGTAVMLVRGVRAVTVLTS